MRTTALIMVLLRFVGHLQEQWHLIGYFGLDAIITAMGTITRTALGMAVPVSDCVEVGCFKESNRQEKLFGDVMLSVKHLGYLDRSLLAHPPIRRSQPYSLGHGRNMVPMLL